MINVKNDERTRKDLYQVYVILNYLSNEQKSKIPKDVYESIVLNMKRDPNFKIDITQDLLSQEFSPMAKSIFVELYSTFISEDKEKWDKYNKLCDEIEEKEKNEKYNAKNLFVNISKEEKQTDDDQEEEPKELLIVNEKETILTKVINFIKNIFILK